MHVYDGHLFVGTLRILAEIFISANKFRMNINHNNDEDQGLLIESFAIINIRGVVSTKKW